MKKLHVSIVNKKPKTYHYLRYFCHSNKNRIGTKCLTYVDHQPRGNNKIIMDKHFTSFYFDRLYSKMIKNSSEFDNFFNFEDRIMQFSLWISTVKFLKSVRY